MKKTRKIAVAIIAALVGFLVSSSNPANAIGFLVSANPAIGQQITTAPRSITLEFSVATIPAQLSGNVIRVTNSSGVAVDQGSVRDAGKTISVDLKSDLEPDRYQVAYRYVCDDGHVLVSAYSFTFAQVQSNPATTPSSTPKPSATSTHQPKSTSTPSEVQGATAAPVSATPSTSRSDAPSATSEPATSTTPTQRPTNNSGEPQGAILLWAAPLGVSLVVLAVVVGLLLQRNRRKEKI